MLLKLSDLSLKEIKIIVRNKAYDYQLCQTKYGTINSLPDYKIVDCSKFKPIADNILECIWNEKYVSYRVENILRKAENVCSKQFLFFSQFSLLYIFSVSKWGIVW